MASAALVIVEGIARLLRRGSEKLLWGRAWIVASIASLTLWLWRGYIETGKYYLLVDLNLREEVDVSVGAKYYKPDPSPALETVRFRQPERVLLRCTFETDAMNRITSAIFMR